MKNFKQWLFAISFPLCSITTNAQTITFKSTDEVKWADGIAEDGDGGSMDIPGITLQFYATNASFQPIPSTILFNDNNWFWSGDGEFNGIMSEPASSIQGEVPAFVIKSADPKMNFSLNSMLIYDWGGSNGQKVEAFNNGISRRSIKLSFDQESWWPLPLAQPTSLPSAIFSNIDEIRITPENAAEGIYPAINDIEIGNILAIHFISFKAKLNADETALLEWKVDGIEGSETMEVEQSKNGKDFYPVGNLSAIKNKNIYQFTTHPIGGTTFFRIKQTAIDGHFSYSRIIPLKREDVKSQINVYPNPAAHYITIASNEIIKECVIRNAAGAVVMKVKPQEAISKIDVSLLKRGNYFITIDTETGTQMKAFIRE